MFDSGSNTIFLDTFDQFFPGMAEEFQFITSNEYRWYNNNVIYILVTARKWWYQVFLLHEVIDNGMKLTLMVMLFDDVNG